MLKSITEAEKKALTEKYVGKRIRLIKMDDVQAPPVGSFGICKFVDGIGQLHMGWEKGGSLALIPDVDEFEIEE